MQDLPWSPETPTCNLTNWAIEFSCYKRSSILQTYIGLSEIFSLDFFVYKIIMILIYLIFLMCCESVVDMIIYFIHGL